MVVLGGCDRPASFRTGTVAALFFDILSRVKPGGLANGFGRKPGRRSWQYGLVRVTPGNTRQYKVGPAKLGTLTTHLRQYGLIRVRTGITRQYKVVPVCFQY